MNNVFNIKRFGWLFRKTIMERPVQLLGLMLLVIAIDIMIYAFCRAVTDFEVAQNASFILGLVGGGCFMASFVYSHFGSNASGSSFLTLPASTFEKWLCGVVITGVFYVLIYLLFFRLMDSIFIYMYHKDLNPNRPFYKEMYDSAQPLSLLGFVANKTYMMFLNFAGFMLVGTLYFNKAPFIKVALIVCAICFGSFLLNILLANMFFGHVNGAFPFYFVYINEHEQNARLELTTGTLKSISQVFEYVLPAILWLLALIRLKEKEF